MRKPRKAARGPDRTPGTAPERQSLARALKWAGGVTAILSLIFGLHQLADLVSASRERYRHVDEFLRTGKSQEQVGDFASAWKSLAEADRLGPDRAKVRSAREDLAMHWLETRLGPDERRFDAAAILSVLERAASKAEGQRKADLLAHAGWAEFLRSDDGAWQRQSREYYREALQTDPQNAYAHAMQGYYALWSLRGHSGVGEIVLRRRIEDARREFSYALSVGRDRDYTRYLQFNGLKGLDHAEADVEFMRNVNDMRKNGEQVSPRTSNTIRDFYSDRLSPSIEAGSDTSAGPTVIVHREEREPLLSALPAADQFATFSWLFDRPDFDPARIYLREYYRAVLQEGSGHGAEALQTLVKARPDIPSNDSEFRLVFDEAIRRLAKKHS